MLDLSTVPAETILANAYQDHPHLRQTMTDALLQVCAALEFPEKPAASWDDTLDIIKDTITGEYTTEMVQGYTMPGARDPVYPLASYGRDRGGRIQTKTINLKKLSTSDAFGGPFAGPFAGLVVRTRLDLPGIAVQYSDAADALTIQIFWHWCSSSALREKNGEKVRASLHSSR